MFKGLVMKTIAQIIKKCPELYREHAIIINRDRDTVKFVFKDFSSLEVSRMTKGL